MTIGVFNSTDYYDKLLLFFMLPYYAMGVPSAFFLSLSISKGDKTLSILKKV